MADVNFEVDYTPHANYTNYEGETSDVLPFDGKVSVLITKVVPYLSKDSGKPMVKITAVCQDEDCQGRKLISNQHCGGVDRNGDPLSRQIMSVQVSAGEPVEKIQDGGKRGAKEQIAQIVQKILNKIAFVEVERGEYDGKPVTNVKNWIPKNSYLEAVATHSTRKTIAAVATGTGGNLGIVGGPGARNGQAAQAAEKGSAFAGL